MKIEKCVLETAEIRLEPVTTSHGPGLAAAISDGELWKIRETLVPHPDTLGAFFEDAEAQLESSRELAFTIIDKDADRVVGSSRFREIDLRNRRVEIGATFLAESSQGTHINATCKYLMLSHAFETWEVNRVEFITDARNARSRAALTRIGAREEGTLRMHMLMPDGHVRDSVQFSIIRPEWPEVRGRLAPLMHGARP